MKKRYYVVAVAALFLGLLVWLRAHSASRTSTPMARTVGPTVREGSRTNKTGPVNEFAGAAPGNGDPELKKREENREREREKVDDEWRTPIRFYGKVVDERGIGVPAADVEFAWNNLSGSHTKDGKSDLGGNFSFAGEEGKVLFIHVKKDGYYSSTHDQHTFFYAGENENFVPAAGDPVIFHLQKKGNPEPLHVMRGGYNVPGEGKQFLVPKDGSPIQIDLMSGQTNTFSSSDFRLQCTVNDRGKASGEKFDWSCVLSVSGGGIIESTNQFAFIAPQSGYATQVEIRMLASNETAWQRSVKHSYFLILKDGRFARVNFSIYAGDTTFCEVEAFINPTGSRNLEYDPEKTTVGNQ